MTRVTPAPTGPQRGSKMLHSHSKKSVWLLATAVAILAAIIATHHWPETRPANAHPDHPIPTPTGMTITPSPSNIQTGEVVTLSGQEFGGTEPVRVYYDTFHLEGGVIEPPDAVDCPSTLTDWTHLPQITERPDDDGNWEYDLRVTAQLASDANYIAFCGADSENKQTAAAPTAKLNPETVRVDKKRAYPGETLLVTGRNWPALERVRIYAVPGHAHGED